MGVKSIVFYDDCSFSDMSTVNEEMNEFSKMMSDAGRGAVWQIEMRPDIANSLDENSIAAMYKSGCRQINLGIEKGTLKGLGSIEKALQPEQAVEACKKIKTVAPSLRLAGTFILGGPGETYQDAVETIEYSRNLGLLFAHFYPLEIYPGTRLYQKAFGSDMRAWLDLILRDTVFEGSIVYEDLLGKEDIAELTCKAYRAFYRRKEWVSLGKMLLGSHFETVSSVTFSWGENPRW
ncbi:radical SAM protein, partial [Candidatus Bathyarchaeota archaeon]|nr:radical SAM protein [Candidatus Bathyarchaeota archaeon]